MAILEKKMYVEEYLEQTLHRDFVITRATTNETKRPLSPQKRLQNKQQTSSRGLELVCNQIVYFILG
jgi:hypothetical protein